MAKSKVKKSKAVKTAAKRVVASAKRPSKTASAKKAPKRAAAKPASRSRSASAPASTDIRQAYKSFLLADYLGQKEARPGKKR